MLRYQKGDKARRGYYLNLSNGELIHLEKDGAIPATAEGRFIRFPSLLAVIAAPFVGLAYVVFLPLTGIIAMFAYIGLKFKQTAESPDAKTAKQDQHV